jgi:hypothetical protein
VFLFDVLVTDAPHGLEGARFVDTRFAERDNVVPGRSILLKGDIHRSSGLRFRILPRSQQGEGEMEVRRWQYLRTSLRDEP